MVETWPAGRYREAGNEFRRYWTGPDAENPYRRDWMHRWLEQIRYIDNKIPKRDRVTAVSHSAAETPQFIDHPGEPEFCRALRQRLLHEYEVGTYRAWLEKLTFVQVGDTLLVSAPSSVVANYVRNNHAVRLGQFASGLAGRSLEVRIVEGHSDQQALITEAGPLIEAAVRNVSAA